MTPQSIRVCFSHNQYVAMQMWHCLESTSDTLPETMIALEQLVDIINLKQYWREQVAGFNPPMPFDYNYFRSIKHIMQVWQDTDAYLMEYVNTMTQDELNDEICCVIPENKMQVRQFRWKILLLLASEINMIQMHVMTVCDLKLAAQRSNMHSFLLTEQSDMRCSVDAAMDRNITFVNTHYVD